jgi:uncharacterized protein
MPLSSGKSKAAFKHNIEVEVGAGKPQRQAVAIAYSKRGEDEFEVETEDCNIEMDELFPESAHDGVPQMAFDRSLRTKDLDGRLHVRDCNISKANICPYLGHEIPDRERLGLDPDRVYYLYRDAAALCAAAPTAERVPLMMRHVSSTALAPQKETIIGCVSNVRWRPPYLVADLTVWDAVGIEAIESERQQELSPGYRYMPVMESGVLEGERYDGRMSAPIIFNHVAIVDTGRTGPDVVVNDGVPMAS